MSFHGGVYSRAAASGLWLPRAGGAPWSDPTNSIPYLDFADSSEGKDTPTDPNGIFSSATDEGDDSFTLANTGGAVRDGFNEGCSWHFTPKDTEGNVVTAAEWRTGKYLFMGEVEYVTGTDHDVMVAIGLRPAASVGAVGEFSGGGVIRYASTTVGGSVNNSATSNIALAAAGITKLRVVNGPFMGQDGGNYEIGALHAHAVDSSDDLLSNYLYSSDVYTTTYNDLYFGVYAGRDTTLAGTGSIRAKFRAVLVKVTPKWWL